jgi:hypothetical protein
MLLKAASSRATWGSNARMPATLLKGARLHQTVCRHLMQFAHKCILAPHLQSFSSVGWCHHDGTKTSCTARDGSAARCDSARSFETNIQVEPSRYSRTLHHCRLWADLTVGLTTLQLLQLGKSIQLILLGCAIQIWCRSKDNQLLHASKFSSNSGIQHIKYGAIENQCDHQLQQRSHSRRPAWQHTGRSSTWQCQQLHPLQHSDSFVVSCCQAGIPLQHSDSFVVSCCQARLR